MMMGGIQHSECLGGVGGDVNTWLMGWEWGRDRDRDRLAKRIMELEFENRTVVRQTSSSRTRKKNRDKPAAMEDNIAPIPKRMFLCATVSRKWSTLCFRPRTIAIGRRWDMQEAEIHSDCTKSRDVLCMWKVRCEIITLSDKYRVNIANI